MNFPMAGKNPGVLASVPERRGRRRGEEEAGASAEHAAEQQGRALASSAIAFRVAGCSELSLAFVNNKGGFQTDSGGPSSTKQAVPACMRVFPVRAPSDQEHSFELQNKVMIADRTFQVHGMERRR